MGKLEYRKKATHLMKVTETFYHKQVVSNIPRNETLSRDYDIRGCAHLFYQ